MDPDPLADVHILLDALALGALPVGVGRYVTTLVRGLIEAGVGSQVSAVVRPQGRPLVAGIDVLGPGPLLSSPPLRPLWEQLALPRLARITSAGLVHGLMGVVPLCSPVPSVVTVHDVTFLSHPELHTRAKTAYFRALLPLAARVARRVLTDSEASKGEIVRRLRIDERQVAVVPLAIDPVFHPPSPEEAEAARARFAVGGDFVLYAGVLEPRKNLPRLISAIARLRRRGYPHRLVLAGKPGWRLGAIETAIAAAPGAVLRLGFVSDSELRALLGGCAAFAYVPLAEGFGLPVAEALACGAPVVTSSRSSLPEVAGGAALLVDPESDAEIESGLERVLGSAELRARLAALGPMRAAALTPRELALGTLAAYRQALGSG